MSYVSLYRKYRSQSFAELVEQTAVVQTLQNAIKFERIAQSYIFAGPRGTGKTSVARIFAKTLNCSNLKNDNPEPCNTCDNCKQVTAGTHMDVMEIDAASTSGVDNIRDLIEKVNFLPSMGKWKIYIIDETHMLSTSAFNALLKTIEEPPAHAIFILATTDPHKIPVTIQSRCQRLDFTKISQSAIVGQIQHILKEEKMKITEDAIKLIAKYSGGHMRDALSITDQVLSFSDGDVKIDDVYKLLGAANVEDLANIIVGLKNDAHTEYFRAMDKLFYEGLDAVLFLEDMLELLRQVLFLKIDLREMILGPTSTIKVFEQVGELLSKEEVYTAIEECSKAIQQVKHMEDSRVFLEVMLYQVFTGQLEQKVIVREAAPAKKDAATPQSAPPKAAYTAPAAAPARPQAVAKPVAQAPAEPMPAVRPDVVLDIVNVKHYWPEILAFLKKTKKAQLSAMLKECIPINVTDTHIDAAIDRKFSFHHKKLNEDDSKNALNAAASEIFSRKITVKVDFKDGSDMPTDLEKDNFEETSYLENSEIPDSIKNIAQQFDAKTVEKVD